MNQIFYITNNNDIPDSLIDRFILIGNFDCQHLGHKALIDKAKAQSRSLKLLLTILTFEPNSRELFSKDNLKFNIFNYQEKYTRLFYYGVEEILVIKNNPDFFNIEAKNFIECYLLEKLHCKAIAAGNNFRFGKNRKGDMDILEKICKSHDIKLYESNILRNNNLYISTTKIREFLSNGDIKFANYMLGYEYYIKGKVIHGNKIGRTLGYPTVNVKINNIFNIKYGVYAGYTRINGNNHESAINIGLRPTINDNLEPILEANIFNFDHELYGIEITIIPIKFIREEKKFNSIKELKDNIKKDCNTIKGIFNDKHM